MRLRRRHYLDALLIMIFAGGALLIPELRGRLSSRRLHPEGSEFVVALQPALKSDSLKVALVITFDGHIMGEVVQVLNSSDASIEVRTILLNGTHEAMVGWKLRNHYMPDPTVSFPITLAPNDDVYAFKAWNVGWEEESYREPLLTVSVETNTKTFQYQRTR